MCAGMPVNQSFGAGMGPILLDNVTCNQSHLELLQCVHPLNIGVHDCDRENVAGVICVNVSTTTVIDAITTFEHPPNITYVHVTTSGTTRTSKYSFFSTLLSTKLISLTVTSVDWVE